MSGEGSKRGALRAAVRNAAWAMGTPVLLALYARAPNPLLAAVALAPWVILYTDRRRPPVSWLYFIPAVWLAWVGLYPQSMDFGWQFPLIAGLICSAVWWPFVPLMRWFDRRTRWPRMLSFPLVWVVIEWLRAAFSIAHFDLYRLGYSLAPLSPMIQLAEWTGVYGLSFFIAAINGGLADLWFAIRDARADGRPWPRKRILIAGTGLLVVGSAIWWIGVWRMRTLELTAGPRLAIVQPNLAHNVRNPVGVHLGQVRLTEDALAAGDADLILWPENAIIDDLFRKGNYLEDLSWLAERKGAWFLVGATGHVPQRPGRTTNSAFLIRPDGEVVDRYDKQLLFPWSEYIPLDDVLGRLSGRLQRIHRVLVRSGWGFVPNGIPGERSDPLVLPWRDGALPFTTLICVENTYPPVPRRASRSETRFIVNLTSEGAVGGQVQGQLLGICMVRAAEARMSYVRAANTGISAFIDPAGRLQSLLRGGRGRLINDAGVLVDHVLLSSGRPTFYSRLGPWVPALCLVVIVVGLIFGGRRRPAALLVVGLLFSGCGDGAIPAVGPDEAREALERGRAAFVDGRRAEALGDLSRACAEAEPCGAALPMLAQSFFAARRPEHGVVFLDALIARYPLLAGPLESRKGYLLERSLDLPGAEAAYRRSLDHAPDPWAYSQLGNLLGRIGRWDEALQAHRAATELAPFDDEARYRLGRALWSLDRLDEAKVVLDRVLARDPGHARSWATLGRIYRERGELASAQGALRQAIEADPESIEARFMLAKIALRAGDRVSFDRLLEEIQALEAGLGRGPAIER